MNEWYPRVIGLLLIVVLLGSDLGATGVPTLAQDGPEGDGPWVVRAYYQDRAPVDEMAAWLEPWEVHHDQGYLVVAVDRAQYDRLVAMGFDLEVDVRLTAELNRPAELLPGQIDGIPGFPCYRTVEETFATAQDLVTYYPHLATWIDVGDSWEKTEPGGNAGYDMMVLRLTNTNVAGPKPKLFIMSAVHAREYATAELNTRFAEYLVYNYGLDADATWLLDYHEIHLLLMSNPDGRKHAEASALWRKNTNENYCGPTSGDRGADLNRNFPFEWSCCGGSSGNPCDETYRGPSAASEPETQAIVNYVRSEFPDQRGPNLGDPAPPDAMGIFIDLHSYSELVLWSWGFTYQLAPNATGLQSLGRKFAYFNGYSPQQAIGLYPTDGTTKDFAYGELGLAGYTFELGTWFFEACSTFENTILPDNMPALLYAAKASRLPYMLPAGPDAVDVAAQPAGVTPGTTIELTATVDDTRFNHSNGIEPTQDVAAAEYYIDVPPWLTTTTPVSYTMAPADGAFDDPVEGVMATLDTGSLAPGRHIVFVRGRDAAGNWGPVSAVFVEIFDPAMAPVIEGYVHDEAGGLPLAATVTAGAFVTQTNPADGFYSMRVMSGTYDITAVADDYQPSTATGVEALDYQTVQQDFVLSPICPILADDVEAGNQGWTAEGNWAISDEAAHSPSHAWTDSPGGNYGSGWDVALTSPALDLSDYTWTGLSFWQIYDLETYYDYGYVEYSTDGGGSWTKAASYTGEDADLVWMQEELPLPDLAGEADVRLRFRLKSDSLITEDGWHLDDITLSGSGPACLAALAPAAAFSSTSPVALGQAMTFTNQTTGQEPLAYQWNFGDGMGTSTETHPVYTYASTGTFTVTLLATNTLDSDTAQAAVVVHDEVCLALAGVALSPVATDTIRPGQEVWFAGDLSPEGASLPYSYTVEFGDSSPGLVGMSSQNPLTFSHVYSQAGTFRLQIEVQNCGGSGVSDSLDVDVEALPTHHFYLPLIVKH
ncbi:MAG: M14 family zinc carboxypeptidase [Anaerolineae bacterium]